MHFWITFNYLFPKKKATHNSQPPPHYLHLHLLSFACYPLHKFTRGEGRICQLLSASMSKGLSISKRYDDEERRVIYLGDVVIIFSEDDDESCIGPAKRWAPEEGERDHWCCCLLQQTIFHSSNCFFPSSNLFYLFICFRDERLVARPHKKKHPQGSFTQIKSTESEWESLPVQHCSNINCAYCCILRFIFWDPATGELSHCQRCRPNKHQISTEGGNFQGCWSTFLISTLLFWNSFHAVFSNLPLPLPFLIPALFSASLQLS